MGARPLLWGYAVSVRAATVNALSEGAIVSETLKGRDKAVYTRQQKGHSLILNLLLIGPLTLFITTIYYSVSPNHYWHA